MEGIGPEQDANLAAVAELLRRERPVPTFDELARVDRRLNRTRTPARPPRRGSRLAVVVCLALGLIFMTAGTGLAISGFATPGTATHAQYPDNRSTGGPSASSRGRGTSGGGRPTSRGGRGTSGGERGTSGGGRGTAAPRTSTGARPSSPSRLGQVRPSGKPKTTVEISLSHAETRSGVPFSGLGAIPILVAGIVLILTATSVNRRARGSWGRV